MKSYSEIADETGVRVEEVREAMQCAEYREIPYFATVNNYDNATLGRLGVGPADEIEETRYRRVWVVLDKYRLMNVEASGRTREEAVINALGKGFRA